MARSCGREELLDHVAQLEAQLAEREQQLASTCQRIAEQDARMEEQDVVLEALRAELAVRDGRPVPEADGKPPLDLPACRSGLADADPEPQLGTWEACPPPPLVRLLLTASTTSLARSEGDCPEDKPAVLALEQLEGTPGEDTGKDGDEPLPKALEPPLRRDPQLLKVLSGLLHRKRAALVKDGSGCDAAAKLEQLDADIRRVEHELDGQQPFTLSDGAATPGCDELQAEEHSSTMQARTPEKPPPLESALHPVGVTPVDDRTASPGVRDTRARLTPPSQGSTATPATAVLTPERPSPDEQGEIQAATGGEFLEIPSPMVPRIREAVPPPRAAWQFQAGAPIKPVASAVAAVRPPSGWPWIPQAAEAEGLEGKVEQPPAADTSEIEVRSAMDAPSQYPPTESKTRRSVTDSGDAVLIGSARPFVLDNPTNCPGATTRPDCELQSISKEDAVGCHHRRGKRAPSAGGSSSGSGGRSALGLTQHVPSTSSSATGKSLAGSEPSTRGKENLHPGTSTPPPPARPSASAEADLPKAGFRGFAGVWASPPSPIRARAASTPGRRVAASFGSSLGLFRETPSPRGSLVQRSPVILQPQSLFVSPSPPRYSNSEQEPLDWAPSGGVFSSASTAAEEGTGPPLPPPLPGKVGRVPSATPHLSLLPSWCTAAPATAGAPTRSPSAPSLANCLGQATPPRRLGAGVPFVVGPCRNSPAVVRNGGDTPRNLTDWRKSLALARRQDETAEAPQARGKRRAPWR